MPKIFLLAAGLGERLENVSTMDPVSPSGDSIRYLFLFVCATSAFILAIVWGVLFYSLVRFRKKRAAQEAADGKEPAQVYGSMSIEIAWTVAPGLIVFLLTLVIVRTEFDVRRDSPPPNSKPLYVTVIGHQWWWEYVVRDEERGAGNEANATASPLVGVVTANELHLPVSTEDQARPTFFTLLSADVCHSFWIPRLMGKTDLIPGRQNTMWFETKEPALYFGQCAEYCGTQHANMLLRVYLDKPDDFAAWLANESKPAVDDAAMQRGKEAFLAQTCMNCHTVRGTIAHGKVGPDLTHFGGRQTLGAGMVPLDRENLRKWITDPGSIKEGVLMPAFGNLGSQDVDLITDYLLSLK
jgi:cytochrome c oxidase subunit 2